MPGWLVTDFEYYAGIMLILAGIWRQMLRGDLRRQDRETRR